MHEKRTYHRLWGGILMALLATVLAFVPGLALAQEDVVNWRDCGTVEELATAVNTEKSENIRLTQNITVTSQTLNFGRETTSIRLNGYTLTYSGNGTLLNKAQDYSGTPTVIVSDTSARYCGYVVCDAGKFAAPDVNLLLRGALYSSDITKYVDTNFIFWGDRSVGLTAIKNLNSVFVNSSRPENTYSVSEGVRFGDLIITNEGLVYDELAFDVTNESSSTTLASGVAKANLPSLLQGLYNACAPASVYQVALRGHEGITTSSFGTAQIVFPAIAGLTSDNFAVAQVVKSSGDTAIVTDLTGDATCTNGVVTLRVSSLPENSDLVIVQKNAYYISFNSNGGSGAMADQAIASGVVTTLTPNAFTRTNYEFVDWNTKADGSGATYADKASVKDLVSAGESITLYAQWFTADAYTVFFNKNGGSGSMDNQIIDRDVWTALNKNEFTRSGYAFAGWNTKSNGKGTTYANREKVKNLAKTGSSITLYAQWAPYYTITFNSNGGLGSMVAQEIGVGVTERLIPNVFTRAGYAFVGWNTKANGSGVAYADFQQVKDLAKVGGTVILYAQWSSSMPIYRLYNPNSGEHFFTGSEAERVMVESAGWRYEAVAWKAPANSSAPIFRLYNPNGGDHHYTMSAGERDLLVKEGWRYEGIALFSDTAQAVPIYRAYNPNAKTGAHNFTADAAEQAYVVSVGWRNEGIAWYGVK